MEGCFGSFSRRDKTIQCNLSGGGYWHRPVWLGLDAALALLVVPAEHSKAGTLRLSGLKQILLTHSIVSQYHSKPISHAISPCDFVFRFALTAFPPVFHR